MNNKRFDFSVLPDDFFVQSFHEWMPDGMQWAYELKGSLFNDELKYRPLLNHDYFNNGSMVLPNGLVVEFTLTKSNPLSVFVGQSKLNGIDHNGAIWVFDHMENQSVSVNSVRIMGAHADYAEHAKELDMPVVDI